MSLEFDRLDHDGIAAILKSPELGVVVHQAAEEVVGNLGVDADVEVEDVVTDRVVSVVTIKDPRGMVWQSRDGLLTRAAAAAGLEVRAR